MMLGGRVGIDEKRWGTQGVAIENLALAGKIK
jgi:hypothetical protein